ncbi:hypothetical protein chiPu_0026774, partial [Chiloscyllium punctatum]|nr:hypothetical protein [Chiloscyllium punctatum]
MEMGGACGTDPGRTESLGLGGQAFKARGGGQAFTAR